MKKTNLIKGFLIILMGAIMFGTTGVYAADEWDYIFDNTADNTSTSNTAGNTSKNTSNTSKNTSKNTSNTSNTSKNTSNTSNTASNNTTSYNNTSTSNNTSNLPKTGVEDAIPTMALIVVCGISAVYAYKKIKEYNKVW